MFFPPQRLTRTKQCRRFATLNLNMSFPLYSSVQKWTEVGQNESKRSKWIEVNTNGTKWTEWTK